MFKVKTAGMGYLWTGALMGTGSQINTRDMTRLSQVQVVDYLKRKDVIFIPVGAVETNGIMPSDRDYVSPLAYAIGHGR